MNMPAADRSAHLERSLSVWKCSEAVVEKMRWNLKLKRPCFSVDIDRS